MEMTSRSGSRVALPATVLIIASDIAATQCHGASLERAVEVS